MQGGAGGLFFAFGAFAGGRGFSGERYGRCASDDAAGEGLAGVCGRGLADPSERSERGAAVDVRSTAAGMDDRRISLPGGGTMPPAAMGPRGVAPGEP